LREPGSNLARVLAVWGEMSLGQTMAPLVGAMADDVVWRGLLPELVCHGREQVRAVLGSARGGRLPRVTRMEAEEAGEAGERVVVTVEGPDIGPGPEGTGLDAVGGPRTLVLWFEDGRIVRMESFGTRQEAFRATS